MSRGRFRRVLAVFVLLPIVAVTATIVWSAPAAQAGPELVTNGSMTSADPTNPSNPLGWQRGGWGTNARTFTFPANGGVGDSRFARVAITSYSNGDAKWWFAPVPVAPGVSHTYRSSYRATASTTLVAEVRSTTGAVSWIWLRSVPAAGTWTAVSATFRTPTNAASVTVYHLLMSVGTLDIDDVSFSSDTTTPPTTSTTTPPTTSTTTPPTTSTTTPPTTSTTTPPTTSTTTPPTTSTTTPPTTSTTTPPTTSTTTPPTTSTTTPPTTSTTTPPTTSTTTPPTTSTTTPPTTSTTVVVSPPGGGLVPNPSVETPNPSNSALPQSWAQGGWGTNARSFAYPTGGANSGARFLRVTLTSRTSGDAKWWFPHVAVQPGTSYTFSDSYRSSVTTQLVAEIRTTTNQLVYTTPVNVPPSSTWTRSSWTFTTPANAASLTVFHIIQTVGTLDTDDTSLVRTGTPPSPTTTTTVPGTTTTVPGTTTTTVPTSRPVVHLTFDDGPGWDYTPAMLNMLAKYPGVRVTFFPTGTNVRRYPWVAADIVARGHGIGNHTDTHPDLTTLTPAQITSEIGQANNSIFAATGVRPRCFRPPYGRLNSTASSTIASLGYSTVLWTYDTSDWRTDTTTVQMIIDTLNRSTDGSIILMHDWAPNTLIAVDRWLAANASRFEFRSLPQC